MWATFPVFRPNQAHNGYLEIYLNLGWIGLLLFVGVLDAFYRAMREKLDRAITAIPFNPTELAIAKFGIGYLTAYLLYNVTEAIFQPLNFLFIVFLVLGMRYSMGEQAVAAPALERQPAHVPSRSPMSGVAEQSMRGSGIRRTGRRKTGRRPGPQECSRRHVREVLRGSEVSTPPQPSRRGGLLGGVGSGLHPLKRLKKEDKNFLLDLLDRAKRCRRPLERTGFDSIVTSGPPENGVSGLQKSRSGDQNRQAMSRSVSPIG